MDLCATLSTSQDARKGRENEESEYETNELPDDLIFEILSWLPAKSLCKFKCCSKSIFKLIKHKTFAVKQSQNLLQKDDSCFFIQPGPSCPWNFYFCNIEIQVLPTEKASSCDVPRNFLHFLNKKSTRIIASSNGLLLCQIGVIRSPMRLFLCNPTTRSCSFIPNPKPSHHSRVFWVLAFECNYKDYKLVALGKDLFINSSCLRCKIYSPKEGVWKARERSFFVGNGNIRFDLPVFYKGAIYFVSQWSPYYMPYIASYNLESGISKILKLPREFIERDKKLYYKIGIFKWGKVGSLNESICLVTVGDVTVFTVWILTDTEYNWSRFLTISLKEMGLRNENFTVRRFAVMNGHSLIFSTQSQVYMYDLIGEGNIRLQNMCEDIDGYDLHFFSYSSTLRSCGGSATLRIN